MICTPVVQAYLLPSLQGPTCIDCWNDHFDSIQCLQSRCKFQLSTNLVPRRIGRAFNHVAGHRSFSSWAYMRGSRDVSYYKCALRVDTSNQTAIGTISNLQIWYGLRGVGIPKQNLIINTSFWAKCNLSKNILEEIQHQLTNHPQKWVKYWWSLDIHPVEPPDFWSINSINSRLQDSWLPNIVNPRLHQQS